MSAIHGVCLWFSAHVVLSPLERLDISWQMLARLHAEQLAIMRGYAKNLEVDTRLHQPLNLSDYANTQRNSVFLKPDISSPREMEGLIPERSYKTRNERRCTVP